MEYRTPKDVFPWQNFTLVMIVHGKVVFYPKLVNWLFLSRLEFNKMAVQVEETKILLLADKVSVACVLRKSLESRL